MTSARHGAQAYEAASRFRSARDQEADVLRRATGALRSSMQRGPVDRGRAVSDNRRLWIAISDLMADPTNALPPETRGGIISLSIAVRREMDKTDPDFGFLIRINETLTAGLAGAP